MIIPNGLSISVIAHFNRYTHYSQIGTTLLTLVVLDEIRTFAQTSHVSDGALRATDEKVRPISISIHKHAFEHAKLVCLIGLRAD